MKACVWSAQGEARRHAAPCVSAGVPLPLAPCLFFSFFLSLSLLLPSLPQLALEKAVVGNTQSFNKALPPHPLGCPIA